MILLVVWSANGDGSALTAKVNLLNDDTYQWDCATVIVSSFGQINRARCTLNKEILDLLNEKSISGACSGRASL